MKIDEMLALAERIGSGEAAKVTLLNEAKNADLKKLRAEILKGATSDEQRIADFARDYSGSDFEVLCSIAHRKSTEHRNLFDKADEAREAAKKAFETCSGAYEEIHQEVIEWALRIADATAGEWANETLIDEVKSYLGVLISDLQGALANLEPPKAKAEPKYVAYDANNPEHVKAAEWMGLPDLFMDEEYPPTLTLVDVDGTGYRYYTFQDEGDEWFVHEINFVENARAKTLEEAIKLIVELAGTM